MKYRSEIQGLRAVAVLAVIIFHLNPNWLPGGFIGVDIFLVISGFLIGSILLHEKDKSEYSFKKTINYFYITRFKRIVPAYWAMLILVSVMAAILFLPSDFDVYKNGLKKAFWFNSNNYFSGFGDYFAPANHEQPLLHTWSLAVEIQFYLLAPIIFLFVPRKKLYWMLPVVVLILTAYAEYRMQQGIHQATYYSLLSRLPAFFMGGWIALISGDKSKAGVNNEKNKWLSYFAITVVFMTFAFPKPTGNYPGISSLVPIFAISLLIWVNDGNRVMLFLSAKWLLWVGALSYSLYLWHWPVLAIFRYYTGAQILDWKFTLAFTVLTFGLSIASYYFIETPLRKKRSKRLFLGYAFLLILTIGSAVGVKKVNTYFASENLSIEYKRYADPIKICHGQIIGNCLVGDLNKAKEVLVLGDSHGAMLNHFFDYLGKEQGFKARIITASSCVTIPNFDYQRIPEWAHKACLDQIEEVKKYLSNYKIIFIAALWTWHLPSDEFKKSLVEFLNSQNQAGKKVYIFEQEPLLIKNPLRSIHFKSLGFDPRIEVDFTYRTANASLQRLMADYSNLKTLNFEATDVFANLPFMSGVPIYYDEHHLNEVGAKYYAEAASDKFREILD